MIFEKTERKYRLLQRGGLAESDFSRFSDSVWLYTKKFRGPATGCASQDRLTWAHSSWSEENSLITVIGHG